VRRRRFIAVLSAAGAALAMPPEARPQELGRTYRLGILIPTPRSAPNWVALLDELRGHGFVEGANLTITGFDVGPSQLEGAAAEMVSQKVDAIVTGGPWPTDAARRATRAIPILTVLDDFIGQKFALSLSHPEGNITGVSIFGPELDVKRQQLLTELVPGLHHLATIADPGSTSAGELKALQAAHPVGVALSIHQARNPEEITSAIDAARAEGAEAINVLASQLFNANHAEIIAAVARVRLPALYQWPEWAEEGGLAAYGPRFASIYRQVALQLIKVLRGAKPGDIPIEQPTKVELLINLKTAKALGLTVPSTFIARADDVIE
jgi:putative ABC transport system substrate-binding protein